jgi:hypothetical protein
MSSPLQPRSPALVLQDEPKGCGVACLAMLTGLSYREARDLFGRRYRPETGMSRVTLDAALARFRLAVCRAPGASLLGAVHVAEVIHRDQAPRTHHFVVVLADGTVLDPLRAHPTTLASYRRVRCMAAVIPLDATERVP